MKIVILFLTLLSIISNVGCVPVESTFDKDLIRCKNPSDGDIDISKAREAKLLQSTVSWRSTLMQ